MAQGHSTDEYLETIYFLAFPVGEYQPATKGSRTVAVRVADMLGVSRASASEMLKRLEADGLVERGEHKEAILTPEGRKLAERAVRRHRIIERLLTDFMGYTPGEAHEQADLLGDTFTDEMIERIAKQLGTRSAARTAGPSTPSSSRPRTETSLHSPTWRRARAPRSSDWPSTTASSSTGTTTRASFPARPSSCASHSPRRARSPSS